MPTPLSLCVLIGLLLVGVLILGENRGSRDYYRLDFERRNAKLTTCGNPSSECAPGIDDGKPCVVSSLDLLDGTVVPYVSVCDAPGSCSRGSCCNFAQYPLLE